MNITVHLTGATENGKEVPPLIIPSNSKFCIILIPMQISFSYSMYYCLDALATKIIIERNF